MSEGRRKSSGPIVLCAMLALSPAGCDREAHSAPIAARAILAQIDERTAPLILDVRTPAEFAAGRVPGAINISIDELAQRIGEIKDHRDREVVIYCERGPRAVRGAKILADAGFVSVRRLDGDMAEWRASGLPLDD